MPTEVTEAEKAMRKLSRESAPAKVLRAPYQLAQARMAIERFEAAKNIKTESRVRSFFRRNRGADAPLDIQLKALKIREEALANDFIEGTLTPLTEAETWEVRCEWEPSAPCCWSRKTPTKAKARRSTTPKSKKSAAEYGFKNG